MDQSGTVNLDPGDLAVVRGSLGEIPIDPQCREDSPDSETNLMPHPQRSSPRLQISVTVEVPAVSNLEGVGELDAANDADDEGRSEDDNDAYDDEKEAQEDDGDGVEGNNYSQVHNSGDDNSGDDGDDRKNEDNHEEDDGNTEDDEEESSDSSSIIGGPDGRLMCDDEDSSDEDYSSESSPMVGGPDGRLMCDEEDSSDEDYSSDSSPIIGGPDGRLMCDDEDSSDEDRSSDSSPIIGEPDGRLMCDDEDSSDEDYSSDSSLIIGGPDGRLMCDDTDSSDETVDDPSSDEDLNFDGFRSEQVGTGSASTEDRGVVGLPENSHDIENSPLPVINEEPTNDSSPPRLRDHFRRILPAEDILRNLAVAVRERHFMDLIGSVVGTVFGAARRRG
ncbi:MAG: hypothetical protein M1835_000170 [Candelina submexicana]|nr:MAG: hypothetical protein M1835_000170 [Candelina submexicana]